MPSAEQFRQQADKPLDPTVPQTYEIRERQKQEQPADSSARPDEATSAPKNEDYEPTPSQSITLTADRQAIVDAVIRLYSGSGNHKDDSTGERDMHVYAKTSVYDDIASYCDTRYKIAGQWYGIPVVMTESKTLAVEIVESSEAAPAGQATRPAAIVFKMKRAWTPRGLFGKTFDVNHLVTLSLEKATPEDGEGPAERIKYHKDQWNEKDYSHGGLGKVLKTINGDMATIGTRPPKSL